MRTIRSGATLAVATTLLALVLVGCGRGDSESSPVADSAPVDDSPATGEVQVWAFGAEGEALTGLAERFEEQNPDVDIVITPVPNDELPRKVEAAVATGNVPDIVQPSTALPSYVATGGLAPVPEGLVDQDDFFTGAVEAVTFDGVAYAVPWYVTVQALYWNQNLATEAGVEAPETWDETNEFGIALREAGADRGLHTFSDPVNSWQAILGYIYQAGGDVLDGEEFTLDTPEVVTALEQYSFLFESGASDPAFQPELGEMPLQIAEGDLGALSSGSFLYEYLLEAVDSPDEIGVSKLPAGPEGSVSYLGGSGLSVFTDAPNPDAAWKFIRFLSEPESQQEFYELAGVLPAAQAAWDSGRFASEPVFEQFREQLEVSRSTPSITTWLQIRSIISETGEQVARGLLTPEEAAERMQTEAEAVGIGD